MDGGMKTNRDMQGTGGVAKIKWLRLKRIAQEITGRQINLHCSTTLKNEIKAATSFNDKSADIALNLEYAKSVKEIIRAIAHELAHIILNTEEHGNEFMAEWNRLEAEITQKYYEGGVQVGRS